MKSNLELARECGAQTDWHLPGRWDPELSHDDIVFWPDQLDAFACVIIQKDRELRQGDPAMPVLAAKDAEIAALRRVAQVAEEILYAMQGQDLIREWHTELEEAISMAQAVK